MTFVYRVPGSANHTITIAEAEAADLMHQLFSVLTEGFHSEKP